MKGKINMAKKPMPPIDTEEQFADFLDNYDTADYWDEFEDVEIKVNRPPQKNVTLKLYPRVLAEIKKHAAQRGIPYQTLIGQWLAERVSQERMLMLKTSALEKTPSP